MIFYIEEYILKWIINGQNGCIKSGKKNTS